MKLVLAVGPQEFRDEIAKIFSRAGITIYSQSNITGHSEHDAEDLRGNWFAHSSDDQRSVMFFSFTETENAAKVVELAKAYNETLTSKSRIKAFILPVEAHS